MEVEDPPSLKAVSPELDQMLSIYDSLLSTSRKCCGILEKCNDISWDDSKGLSLLDVKTDTMLGYLTNLAYVILKKSCGQSIEDIETRERLVHMRVILEKIKPIEDKLKYQIDKMIKSAVTGQSSSDKTSFRANLDDLESSASENDEGTIGLDGESNTYKKSGVYKPPKLASVPYNDESKQEKQRKLIEYAKRRALNSSVMQELKEEYLDSPLEITTGATLRNTHTKYKKERENYEETYFTRLTQTKKDKHRDKVMSQLTLGTLGRELTRFEDISALEGQLPGSSSKRKKVDIRSSKKKKKGFKRRRTF